MDICHAHNAARDLTAEKRFGVRVSMRPGDTFARLIGDDWERYYWYSTEAERDAALEDMGGEHLYSRRGDEPTLIYTPVEREAG